MRCFRCCNWIMLTSTLRIIAHKYWCSPDCQMHGRFSSTLPIYWRKNYRCWFVATLLKAHPTKGNASSCTDKHANGSKSTKLKGFILLSMARISKLEQGHYCRLRASESLNRISFWWATNRTGKHAIKTSYSHISTPFTRWKLYISECLLDIN